MDKWLNDTMSRHFQYFGIGVFNGVRCEVEAVCEIQVVSLVSTYLIKLLKTISSGLYKKKKKIIPYLSSLFVKFI